MSADVKRRRDAWLQFVSHLHLNVLLLVLQPPPAQTLVQALELLYALGGETGPVSAWTKFSGSISLSVCVCVFLQAWTVLVD